MEYDIAIEDIVGYAMERMDDCPTMSMPDEGSDEEAVLIKSLTDALKQCFEK